MRLGSRRFRFIGLGVLVIVVAVTAVVLLQGRAGHPTPALAEADSTTVGDSATADAGKKHGKKGKGDEKETPPVPVEIAEAAPRDLPSTFLATGSLEATRQVDLISKAQGQIVSLRLEEGDFVKEGQILMEIDHREDDLLVEQSEVKAQVAKRELERMKGLQAKGLGSEQDFEVKKETADVAALEENLSRVRRDDKIVRAPFDGQITVRHVELGQTVKPGDPLFSIADVSPLEVRLYLPEKIVTTLAPGQPVEIRSDVDADRPLDGRVSRIAPAVDPATSTVKVTLEVENATGSARVGSFVRGRITTDVHEDVITVPKKALVAEAGMNYLFVVEADSVQKVPVTTGYSDDDYMEITSGLDLGDRVVTVGQGGLRPGSKIRDLAAETKKDADKDTADVADAGSDSAGN